MRIGLYPGSFDPLTFGHLDIIERAKNICDKLIIAIGKNSEKLSFFSFNEKQEMINACCESLAKGFIEVVSLDGLVADFCKANKIGVIIRGIRCVADYEYESPIAALNKKLAPDVETAFLLASGDTAFISSRMVKEVASYHGDVSAMVPKFVYDKIREKYNR